MLQYKIEISNIDDTVLWRLPYESSQITWNLNNVHTQTIYVSFALLQDYLARQGTTAKDLFESGFMNVRTYKREENVDTLVFAGYVSEVAYRKYAEDFNVEINVKSWLGYFENRYYSGSFSGEDAGSIAWDVINSANDIGITAGTITATKNRDRSYRYDEIAKIIRHLTINEINDGFDFDISNQKVLTVGPSIGASLINTVFNERNIISYDLSVGLVGHINTEGHILGGTVGETQQIQTYDAGITYSDAWHVQEAQIKDVGVESSDILLDKITRHVEDTKNPVRRLKLKAQTDMPNVFTYNVGDSVRIKLSDVSINEMMRISKKSLYIGGDDYVSLEFLYG